jgi:hypothetical protein
MGSLRRQRISDAGICRLYRNGESRAAICLAAGLYDAELVALLVRNGVPIRTQGEARDLARASRLRRSGKLRLKLNGTAG